MRANRDVQPAFYIGDRVCLRSSNGALTNQVGVVVQVYITARGFYKISIDGRSGICHASDLALAEQPAAGSETPPTRSSSWPEKRPR